MLDCSGPQIAEFFAMSAVNVVREPAMPHKYQGFTFVELMIVVAITGVLAALALPSYQGFVAKSQVNRAVSELGAYRAGYEASLSNNETISNVSLGYVPSQLTTGDTTTEIATTNADGSGHLEVTLGGSVQGGLAGTVIRFERSVEGQWQCVVDSFTASAWKDSYLPTGCVSS